MKVLIDTSVIIHFLRTGDKKMKAIFEKEEMFLCGVVKAELLHGTVSKKDAEYLERILNSFPSCDMEKSDWVILGRRLNMLRMHGINVPFQDVMIAHLAIKNDLAIWTMDKHFKNIQNIFPELKLYEA